MQATITYLLTEQAQRAQMAATGQPVARKQTLTLDVTDPADISAMSVDADGNLFMNMTESLYEPPLAMRLYQLSLSDGGDWNHMPPALDYFADGHALLAKMRSDLALLTAARTLRIETERKEKEARLAKEALAKDVTRRYHAAVIAHFLADTTLPEPLRFSGSVPFESVASKFAAELSAAGVSSDVWSFAPNVPGFDAFQQALRDRDAQKEAEDAALEAAKKTFIDAWIATHSEPLVQQQHADGLLCRSTAVSMIADAALDACLPAPADTPPEICDDRDCPCGSKPVTCIPPRLYPAWREMRAKLPAGYEVQFTSRRDCLGLDYEPCYDEPDAQTAGPKYWTATVTIPCGPFHFTRTVKLG